MDQVMGQRDDELQRVAALAAAEVVRIIGQVPGASAVTVAAESMRKDVEYIKESVGKIEEKLDTHYVTIDQFDPVKRIVYGVATIFGAAFVAAIAALVFRR